MRTKIILIWTLLVGLSFGPAAGCSTTKGAADKAAGAAANVLLPPEQEEQLGDEFSAEIEGETDPVADEAAQAYIDRLGKLAVQSARDDVPKGIKFEFSLIDAPDTVNAFAGPGGQVYFYSGLLLQADSTAEVLAVMCHEVAHVTQRHIAKRLVTTYGVQALASAALGRNPGLVAQLGASVATQGFLLKYSRDAESQADRAGFQYMLKTGYDPHGFISFFEKIAGAGPSPPQFLSTHPNPKNRIRAIRGYISEASTVSDNRGVEEHQQIVERLRK